MAKNLSERLLDMVEDDARFVGLEPATVIVWLKVVRLFYRTTSRRPGTLGYSFSFGELTGFLRITEDELTEHYAALISRRLLVKEDDKIFAPPECRNVSPTRPSRVESPRFVPQVVPMVRR